MAEPNVVTQPNPDVQEGLEPLGEGEGQGEGQPAVEEPRLLAGKYKTPEELEEAYANSNREATRMAQVLKQLTAQLTGKPTVQPDGPAKTGFEGFFDKETGDALKWLIQNHLAEFATSQKSHESYTRQVSEIWAQTQKDFPDVTDSESELFKLADKILFERGLAERNDKGELVLATPYAYRIAVEAASTILAQQAPQKLAVGLKKTQATAVSGRATGFTPQGKLTPEQYDKLSDEDKDKYDQWQLSQGRR